MKIIRPKRNLFLHSYFTLMIVMGSISCSCHQNEEKRDDRTSSQQKDDPIAERAVSSADLTNISEILSLDPLASEQWHIHNTGQSTFSLKAATPYVDLRMNNALVQDIAGAGIKIAISDTGLDIEHADLQANINESLCRNYSQNGPNFQGNPTPEAGSASDAHGTMVAGIIAAVEKNGIGIRGVAPKAQIAGFRYLGTPVSKDKMIDQALGDFDIFNYSYGSLQCSISSITRDQVDSIKLGSETLRNGKGAIYVKAAGNEWSGILSTCNTSISNADDHHYYGNTNFEAANTLPYIMVVGAIGSNGNIASYSTPGANIWVVAPGGEDGLKRPAILTTDLSGCQRGAANSSTAAGRFDSNQEINSNCDYTSRMRGSSAATPMVSAVSALLLSVNSELSWRDIKYILATTADKPNSPDSVNTHPRGLPMPLGLTYQEGWTTNAAGYSFHNWFGFGSVNTDRAIEMAKNFNSNWSKLISTTIPTTNESVYRQEVKLEVPDFDGQGASDEISVLHDLIIESVQLEVTVDHTKAQDLAIELYSPQGTKSIVINALSGITDEYFKEELFGTNAFYGEKSLGQWKIRVVDAEKNQQGGVLQSWGLRIFGHANGKSQVINLAAPTALSILSLPQGSSILESPIFQWEAEDEEKNILRFEISLIDETGLVVLPWTSVGTKKTAQISQKNHRVRFYKKKKYQLFVRSIGMGEQASAPTSLEWISE